ncbi:alpha/beta fold hydrolase [Spirosoma agri]|uniref:Alpha/beta hydrolase n=1 Tax=Spirosoma agri TaxID=1987381 RepID=A0A6M0IB02_9BACT|nr:alpha/beta hydrolase [Spirosoma agri]NEU65300.1 alpha/beta hydrolase [Spirosoma agri]
MRISVNGIQLNVLDQGSGPRTIVFMHYFGGSALEWQSVMTQLATTYRCIAIDLRGCGDSESSPTGYSVDDMADDVASLVQAMELTDFVLVGHSMSGKIALALAARQPVGLKSLLLVSPSPPVPEPIPDEERTKLLEGYGLRSAAEQTLKNITEVTVAEAVQEQIIADDLRTSRPAWDAWLLEGSKEDISDRMHAINVPISILVGTEDRALPPDVQTRLVLPHLNDATIDQVKGAGHLLPWEVPDELINLMQKKVRLIWP